MSGPDDTVRRGPQRWMRAAVNSAQNPNSHGARLYRHRVGIADQIAEQNRVTGTDQPYAFLRSVITHYDPSTSRWAHRMKREYATCSVFCAVMQSQLVVGLKTLEDVGNFFVRDGGKRTGYSGIIYLQVEVLDRSTLKRKVRCQVCGTEVKRA